jgi:transposase
MIIIGCDFHPSFQQIAVLDTATGATTNYKLMHATGEAERFYRRLTSAALVGIEAVGNDQWFVQLLQKLDHEVWIGDAAQIRASYVRKQKTDRRDAKHILQLLVEGRFHVSGYQVQRCVTIASCSSIGTNWCRYARGSRTNYSI